MRGSLTQLQVVHALLLRETKTRFGATHLGYLWAVAEPLVWIATFSVFYGLFGHLAQPGLPLVAFLTTGIIPFSLFRDTASRCLTAIEANKGLLFYPQVRPLDLVLARVLLEVVTHLFAMAVIMGGLAIYYGPPRVEDWLEMLTGLGLASGLGASFGLLFCGLSVFSPTVERLFPSLIRPFFWISAVFHPVESLPRGFRDFLLLNPLVHAIEMTRDGWFPGYEVRHLDPWYAASWILVMLFFGLSLERVARRRLEIT